MADVDPRRRLLTVDGLRVGFRTRHGPTEAVRGIGFTLDAGECLAVVGESGSGKSVTARALVGLTGPDSSVRAAALELEGEDLRGLGDRRWRRIRGSRVGLVLQDALVSLDPLRRVEAEVAEALRNHRPGPRGRTRQTVLDLLEKVGMPEPPVQARQYPHELSGGLRQRALIASAIACDPAVLIADEPTTALDVTVQARVLDLLAALKADGSGVLLISHDLAVVARLADRVAVMYQGRFVEEGPAREVLRTPRHPYTRSLLAAVPSTATRRVRLGDGAQAAGPAAGAGREPAGPGGAGSPLLEVRGLAKGFRGPDGRVRHAARDVSFSLRAGRTLGVLGESGSGKTTVARMVLGLVEPDAGEVRLAGQPWSGLPEQRRRARRHRVQLVQQDPFSSFDPRYPAERVVGEALGSPGGRAVRANRARIRELFELVGLDPELGRRRPGQLSGGQRQRVALARALATGPELIVCDEPVSALDVSVQAQILDLLAGLRDRLGLSLLFISHDLGVVRHVSDEVIVMRGGRVVEAGPVDELFARPAHPYTRALLTALPRPEDAWERLPPGGPVTTPRAARPEGPR